MDIPDLCGFRGCLENAVPGAWVEAEVKLFRTGWGSRSETKVVRICVCENHLALTPA